MDQFVLYLMIIAEVAIIYFVRRHIKKEKDEVQQETPQQKSIRKYGFDMFSVSISIDNALDIRKQLEILDQLQTQIDIAKADLYRENKVVQIQWYDANQCQYVYYDLRIGGKNNPNACYLEQVVAYEKKRLSTSLFGEFEKIRFYGEDKADDKTGGVVENQIVGEGQPCEER